MKLDGSLAQDLEAALKSARRLRGHPVDKDTEAYWVELLAHCRAGKRSCTAAELDTLEPLMASLQDELASREKV